MQLKSGAGKNEAVGGIKPLECCSFNLVTRTSWKLDNKPCVWVSKMYLVLPCRKSVQAVSFLSFPSLMLFKTSVFSQTFLHYSLQGGIDGIPLVESQLQGKIPLVVSLAYGRSSKSL